MPVPQVAHPNPAGGSLLHQPQERSPWQQPGCTCQSVSGRRFLNLEPSAGHCRPLGRLPATFRNRSELREVARLIAQCSHESTADDLPFRTEKVEFYFIDFVQPVASSYRDQYPAPPSSGRSFPFPSLIAAAYGQERLAELGSRRRELKLLLLPSSQSRCCTIPKIQQGKIYPQLMLSRNRPRFLVDNQREEHIFLVETIQITLSRRHCCSLLR